MASFLNLSKSFGYGLMATPLQLARMYSILGNKGVLYPVSILKLKQEPEGTQVLSPEVAQSVMEMLVGVTEKGGTALKAHIEGYPVAGKTGTARKAVAGGYGEDYVALFAGVAPVHNPKLAIAVVVNEPKGDRYYGGDIAAPVFAAVMSGALQMLNVEPISKREKVRLAANSRSVE